MSNSKNNKQINKQSTTQLKVESKSSTDSNTTVKPTWQNIEKAMIEIVKASLAFNMPKTGIFLKNWKRKINELRKTDEPHQYIIENAMKLFPNEDQYRKRKSNTKEWYQYKDRLYKSLIFYYKMNYIIAKDHFKSEEQLENEADDFLNEENNSDNEFENFVNS